MAFSKAKQTERNFQVALCTAPDSDTAESLAEKMVKQKLAACVNIIPAITSVYEWQGDIEKEPEVLMVIKTDEELMGQLEELLEQEHPYEVFELISCNIDQAATAYLQWLNGAL
ncbi:divalent-cation tolerance protein CutA [Kangiella marina]|uniref:Divalent cation tolerance protein CutA n=1 Tax=Kangiella marina TaxID=1079178 RepID=A0ABP8IKC0_9GAMM